MKARTIATVAAVLFSQVAGWACTTVVVGRKASATGHVIVGHNEDTGTDCTFARFLVPAAEWPAGARLPAEKGLAAVPQAPRTQGFYWLEVRDGEGRGVSPCDAAYNRSGVLVVSNNALCEPCDEPSRLVDGGVLYCVRRAVAERARSARDAVDVVTNLVAAWGYANPGRIYTLADGEEAWQVTVLYGKRFVARRCPDDRVTLTANCCTVRTFEPGDILSDDLREIGGRDFDFSRTFQKRGSWLSGHYLPRWRNLARIFTGRADWDDERLPFAVTPSGRVDAAWVRRALSTHYEGTRDEIPVRTDGRRHDESIRTPVCRDYTLFSSVWTLAARPEETLLDLAAGSPCGHPYHRSRPLADPLPESQTGANAARALAAHFE